MKKLLLLLLLCILAFQVFAQKTSDYTLTFLGFPVDGNKETLIQRLKTKDFTYNYQYDVLSGRFNGKSVDVFISTNYGKVDRVYVASYAETDSKSDIINAFNTLLEQFQKNSKYQELFPNEPIPNEEDIRYEISVENKRYQASFYTRVPVDSVEVYSQFKDIVDKKYPEAQRNLLKGEEKDKMETEVAVIWLSELEKRMTGNVWFMINYHLGKYSIGIYYDNLKNRPNGEDL